MHWDSKTKQVNGVLQERSLRRKKLVAVFYLGWMQTLNTGSLDLWIINHISSYRSQVFHDPSQNFSGSFPFVLCQVYYLWSYRIAVCCALLSVDYNGGLGPEAVLFPPRYMRCVLALLVVLSSFFLCWHCSIVSGSHLNGRWLSCKRVIY